MGSRDKKGGTVYQDIAGVWWAQLARDELGKRPRRRAASQREAKEKLAELEQLRDKGINLTSKQPTVAEFLQHWLATIVKPHRKPRTYESYDQVVRLYLVPELGKVRLDKLTAGIIQRWVNTLMQRVSAYTVRNAFQRLHAALELAVKWKHLASNPAEHVQLPPKNNVPIRPLDAAQATKLLTAVHGHRLELLYQLAVHLGMRQGELLGIRWKHVNFQKGVLDISELVQKLRSREMVTVAPKSERGKRTLPLSPELLAQLRAHQQRLREEQQLMGEKWKHYDLVFPSSVGTPTTVRNLTRHFKASLGRAGLPTTTRFHDLRHTAATLMIGAGVPLKTVSDILGHSSIKLTADTYGYTFEHQMESALEDLAKLLRGEHDGSVG